MSLAILFHLLCAQHVSDINISIFRSLRLCWWITTSVVLFSLRCVLEQKLLKMDILMSETCWAHNKWNKIASDIKLVFHSSSIAMMHGPINIRFFVFFNGSLFSAPLSSSALLLLSSFVSLLIFKVSSSFTVSCQVSSAYQRANKTAVAVWFIFTERRNKNSERKANFSVGRCTMAMWPIGQPSSRKHYVCIVSSNWFNNPSGNKLYISAGGRRCMTKLPEKRTTKQPLDLKWSRYPRGYIDCALQLQHFCVDCLSLAFRSSEWINLKFPEVVLVSFLDTGIFDRRFLLQTRRIVLWRQIVSFTRLHNCICLEHIGLHTSRTAVAFCHSTNILPGSHVDVNFRRGTSLDRPS